jgi:hypothetical protein
VLDPSLDWLAAKRAAAAHKHLDGAMALTLWLAHLTELLPAPVERLAGLWAEHGADVVQALGAIQAAAAVEAAAKQSGEAADSYAPPHSPRGALRAAPR